MRKKTDRENVISEIRALLNKKSGSRFALCKLSDQDLYQLYQRIRSGTSLNECARALQKKGLFSDSSEDSLRKMIAKLRQRIGILLVPPPVPVEEVPELPPVKAFRDCNDLEQITRLANQYAAVLDAELTQAQQGGILDPNAAKHANAVAALMKQKERLQAVEATKVDESKSLTDHEKAVFQRTVGKLQDGGEQFCMMAKEFVRLCEQECVILSAEELAQATIN